MDKLNNKQRSFVQEYINNGCNGTQAYLKVYKTKSEEVARKSASRLLTKVDIQEYLKRIQIKVEDKAIMSIEERQRFLTEVIKEEALEKGYTMFGAEFDKKANFKTKLSAIDVLNKMDGAYTTNLNINAEVRTSKIDNLIENINKMEDD